MNFQHTGYNHILQEAQGEWKHKGEWIPCLTHSSNIYSMNNWDHQLVRYAKFRIVTGNSKDKVQNQGKREDKIGKAE